MLVTRGNKMLYRESNDTISRVRDSRESLSVCKEDKSSDYLVECARYQFRADDLFPPM